MPRFAENSLKGKKQDEKVITPRIVSLSRLCLGQPRSQGFFLSQIKGSGNEFVIGVDLRVLSLCGTVTF